jgi:hypothetical protein
MPYGNVKTMPDNVLKVGSVIFKYQASKDADPKSQGSSGALDFIYMRGYEKLLLPMARPTKTLSPRSLALFLMA